MLADIFQARPRSIAVVLAALPLCAAAVAHATVYNGNPSNYTTLLSSLQPGDTLQLASGSYTQGLSISGMNGVAGAPITIQGPTDQSAKFLGQVCCNTVEIDNSSFIVISSLTLDGQHIDAPFGVNTGSPTHDITIENLLIINYDGAASGAVDQQIDGISTKGSAWNWVIRQNTIVGAGTGMYLGNSDGSAPFVSGLIEYNLIVNTIGYNTEIKWQLPRPTNIGLPTGDSKTIIRHNTFSKQSNGSSGSLARPNLLVGAFPSSGAGTNDLYEIYGNFFYENPNEALFQGEGNVALYDNLFVADSGDAVHFQNNNGPPQNITILNNTVVASGNGITLADVASGYVQQIVGNAVFGGGTPISGPGQSQNITDNYANAGNYLSAPSAPLGTLDLYPRTGQLAGPTIDLSAFSALDDSTVDFNGTARDGVERGAYAGQGTNPGWQLALAIQPSVGTAAPQLTLQANPTQVSVNGTSTLQWSSTSATGCTASGGWSGAQSTFGSVTTAPLTATTTFTLTCMGAGGSTAQSVTVTVAGTTPPAPTVTLTANPTSAASGATTVLTWSSSGATGCTASGGWSGAQSTFGSVTTAPLTATTTFTLTCMGVGGSTAQSVTVTVAGTTPPAPTVTLTANPTSVVVGATTKLTWSSTNATSCSASGGWSGALGASGSQASGTLTTDTTFALNCAGPGGTVSRSVAVAVSSISASAPSAKSGGGALGWPGLGALALAAFVRWAAQTNARLAARLTFR
jgi:hypothetical protein